MKYSICHFIIKDIILILHIDNNPVFSLEEKNGYARQIEKVYQI